MSGDRLYPQLVQWQERLTRALAIDLPYSERKPFENVRMAAVLALLVFDEPGDEPSLLLTRRTETVQSHKGQMAFPGGHREPGESDIDAALRETHEEVGIAPQDVLVIGELPHLWTPTGFRISPVVGLLRRPTSQVQLALQSDEIAEALWVPLPLLNAPGTYRTESLVPPGESEDSGIRYMTHVYQVGPHRVWGATAAMIKNLLDRVGSVG